jgi:FimV-like protein
MLKYALAVMTILTFTAFWQEVLGTRRLEAMPALVLSLIWGSFTWLVWSKPRFVDWLAANRKAVEYKSAYYQDAPVTLDTVMVRYEYVVSIVHAIYLKETDYEILGSTRAEATRWACGIVSFLLGWWSLPGLLDTPKVLARNWTNAKSITVRQLLQIPVPAPKTMLADAGSPENETKLELASAYLEMNDKDGAREILKEVLRDGSRSQQDRARAMLSRC